jgi:hypothetical protein
MKNFITSLDFLGYQEEIKIQGNDRYQTILGAFLSLIVLFLSVAMTITLGLELFLKTEPILINSKRKFQDIGPYNFSKDGIAVYISMLYSNWTSYMDETIYTVKAKQTIVENVIGTNGSVTQDLQEIELEIIKCADYLTKEDVIAKQISFPYEAYYCIKPDQAQIVGYWTADLYKGVRIDIQKCQNTTENSKCRPIEEIDSILQNGFLETFILNYNIDPESNENYLVPYYHELLQAISPDNGVLYFVSMEKLEFQDDKGLIFKDFTIHEVAKIAEVRPMYIFGEKLTIAELTIEGVSFGDIYVRSYAKAQDLLTNIGGLIKALTLIGYFINLLYSKAFFIVEAFAYHHQIIERGSQIKKAENLEMNSHNFLSGQKNIQNNNFMTNVTTETSFIIIKHSRCRLLKEYFFGRTRKGNVQKILKSFYEMVKKSISVEVFYRNYVESRLMKYLLLNNEELKISEKLFKNLYDEGNIKLTHFNEYLANPKYGEKDRLLENKTINEQLKLLNDIY